MPSGKFYNILIVNPYGIGDVLFMTPLIRRIKRIFPDAYLACFLGSRTKEVLERNLNVDEIFVFDKGEFDNGGAAFKIKMFWMLFEKLKKKHFDLMIDISNAGEYAFLAKMFLKIKTRIGFDYRGRGFFLTGKLKLNGYTQRHIIEYYLELLNLLGLEAEDNKNIDFFIRDEDVESSACFLRENGYIEGEKLFCIFPGGGKSWGADADYKHWPKENFARTANEMNSLFGLRTLLLGSSDEFALGRETAGLIRHKVITAFGKTNLAQTAALIKKSDIVLANDGGPLHLAVSQGVKTVSIFGPVDEKVYGPYPFSERHKVVTASIACRPCYKNFRFNKCGHKECLIKVSPEMVIEALEKLLCVDRS